MTETTQSVSRSPGLAETIQRAIDVNLDDLHVCLPGEITEWDPVQQKACVKPCVQRRIILEDGSELVEALPVITDIPVGFPRGGGYFISFPMAVGDPVMLVFSERSLDTYLSGTGGDVDPNDFRRHDLTDAWAYPGVAPWAKAIAQADAAKAVFGKDAGPQMRIGAALIELGAVADTLDFVALAAKVATELGKLQTHFAALEAVLTGAPVMEAGNGAQSALQVALAAAIAASPYPAPASTAATKVKAV